MGLFESIRLGLQLNKVSIESENDQSVKRTLENNLPLDEKMSIGDNGAFLKNDFAKPNAESYSLEDEWAQFHRCNNLITFVLQFIAVISVQGILNAPLLVLASSQYYLISFKDDGNIRNLPI